MANYPKGIRKAIRLMNKVKHTNTPVPTIASTSASLVNKVANEPKDRPKIAANARPVRNLT